MGDYICVYCGYFKVIWLFLFPYRPIIFGISLFRFFIRHLLVAEKNPAKKKATPKGMAHNCKISTFQKLFLLACEA
ncbi:hypothetical protein [Cytobacillus horneckiae]|uniref:Uncharacterized protein n=1 Tax=Cytobacillus horneckiae TaxID=549687 RepID=A0A2N0ZH65_9BACI|nr:hypothetical protein [Cytobacillus horneckiae]PKG28848.1 hypothetical protein CWS20_11825 [Cytobacillus horneckiae]